MTSSHEAILSMHAETLARIDELRSDIQQVRSEFGRQQALIEKNAQLQRELETVNILNERHCDERDAAIIEARDAKERIEIATPLIEFVRLNAGDAMEALAKATP